MCSIRCGKYFGRPFSSAAKSSISLVTGPSISGPTTLWIEMNAVPPSAGTLSHFVVGICNIKPEVAAGVQSEPPCNAGAGPPASAEVFSPSQGIASGPQMLRIPVAVPPDLITRSSPAAMPPHGDRRIGSTASASDGERAVPMPGARQGPANAHRTGLIWAWP